MATKTFSKFDFIEEEGRQDIYHWCEKRQRKYHGFRKSLLGFRIFAFDLNLLRSFIENFNFMVFLQMALAGVITYACKSLNIAYEVHVTLFVSPIVFPLAFSINTDFQRREKVLEDLAGFKSAAMMWFFCLRDWRDACKLDDQFMKAVRNKLKGLLFHLREYLLTEKIHRRNYILRVIYEDLSDVNQLNEKVRSSELPANSPLIARIIHLLNMMCLSFERLRVIREYRSPRSIRSFTKVLIFALPLLLSPYYVYLGSKSIIINGVNVNTEWSPYYIAIMVAFVFGALQGVQDKLDDPFDGMSEDDINLDSLDEWTSQSLEATVHRTYKIGRFQVQTNKEKLQPLAPVKIDIPDQLDGQQHRRKSIFHKPGNHKDPQNKRTSVLKSPLRSARSIYSDDDTNEELDFHPFAGMLNNIKGNTTILRGGFVKPNMNKSYDDLQSANNTITSRDHNDVIPFNQVVFGGDSSAQIDLKSTASTPKPDRRPGGIFTLFHIPEKNNTFEDSLEATAMVSLVEAANGEPTTGVKSLLASMNRHNGSLSRKNSTSSMHSRKTLHVSCSDSETHQRRKLAGIGDEDVQVKDANKKNNKRFQVLNGSISSQRPLIPTKRQKSLELSETLSSNDDDTIKQLTLSGFKRNLSLSELKTNFALNNRSLGRSNSDNVFMRHQLKDEEIFI